MLVDPHTYEKNRIAKRKHPCINPRCSNFVDIQNSYDICIKCFDLLVDYLGSEHLIFDYSVKPALRHMTVKQLKTVLKKAEEKNTHLKSVKSGSSNCQRRWIEINDKLDGYLKAKNEATQKGKSSSSNSQEGEQNES